MDPYCEQILREEVIYLHSLWRQGPPRRNPNPNPNPSRHLPPFSNPTPFKKQNKKIDKPRGKRGKKGKKNPPKSDPPPPPPVSDVEWPWKKPTADPSPSSSGWPTSTPAPTPILLSAEQQAQFAATQVQNKAVTAVIDFFAGDPDSDGGEDCGSDEDDVMEEDGYEEYQFFLKVFTEEGDLRGYYERNWEGGDFWCLVCGGIGKRKRFKHCVALVQHSITVAKTTKKRAHRAYAQAICRVLGWNIDRLPSIVLSLDDPLGRSLDKPIESQGNAEVGIGDSSVTIKDPGLENVSNGESGLKDVSENSLKIDDANKCMENVDNGVPSLVDGTADGLVNCLEHIEENSIGNELENNQNGIVVVNNPEEK